MEKEADPILKQINEMKEYINQKDIKIRDIEGVHRQ